MEPKVKVIKYFLGSPKRFAPLAAMQMFVPRHAQRGNLQLATHTQTHTWMFVSLCLQMQNWHCNTRQLCHLVGS